MEDFWTFLAIFAACALVILAPTLLGAAIVQFGPVITGW